MYALIVLKPFSLEVVSCSICEKMEQVLQAAEKIDPEVDVEPLFYEENPSVETDRFIFRLTNPEYINTPLTV